MSRRQAQIIKHLRAELEGERKLLRAYQQLYGKQPQEWLPYAIMSGSTATITWTPPKCENCDKPATSFVTADYAHPNGQSFCPEHNPLRILRLQS